MGEHFFDSKIVNICIFMFYIANNNFRNAVP